MSDRLEITVADPDQPAAQHCLREYFAELDRRFDAGFDPTNSLPAESDEMRLPAGLFLVAILDGEPVGCGALKFHGDEPSELKRMWVASSVRGLGVGRRILEELERQAVERGSTTIRLETNNTLSEAIALYRSAGYREVGAFNDERYADHWFEKHLGDARIKSVSDYVSVNLANWNSRVPHHAPGYALDRFRADPDYLSHVVRFDVPRLGNIADLDVVHLQCHIGTDTLSLSRLGARSVMGLDFSAPALELAAQLAADCESVIEYVESELYGAVDALGAERFDLVYTGIGALCWLPDIRRWAQVVATLLRPGGRLFIREGHPMLWALADPRPDDLLVVEYPYFETDGVRVSEPKSYVAHDEPLASPDIVFFNHGLAEIITAVMDAGLTLTAIEEHDTVPWNPFPALMYETEGEEYRLRHAPERLAATYTLQATKHPLQDRPR